jgi:hypothetical protein
MTDACRDIDKTQPCRLYLDFLLQRPIAQIFSWTGSRNMKLNISGMCRADIPNRNE